MGCAFWLIDIMFSIHSAAALNCTHAIFKPRANGVNNFYTQLLRWSNGSGSDLFATLHVYNVWRQKHQRGEFGTCTTKNELLNMRKKENAWADTFGLNVQGLKECLSYVEDIKNRLWRKGIKTNANGVKWTHNDKVIILKVVIAGELLFGSRLFNGFDFISIFFFRSILSELLHTYTNRWAGSFQYDQRLGSTEYCIFLQFP